MNKILSVIAILSISFIVSCNTSDKEKRGLTEQISKLETKLISDSTFLLNKKNAKQLIDLYTGFSDKYPTDSIAPEYLFKAGEMAMNLNQSTQAIVLLNQLEKKYPNHKSLPYCIFFQAFVYETQLHNLEKAEQYYQRFIDTYPTHELADDAQSSINNLGKSLEEIIQGFE